MATNDEVKISPPLGWTRCTLSDLVKCSWGNTSLTKKAYLAEGFTAFSASGPDGFVEQFEHQGPGIVLSAIGARCGRCFLADGNWTAIKNTITFTGPRDSLADLKFLYFYLNRSGVWPVRGAGQPFIGLNDARALELPVPPLNEQRRIVAKIEDLTARSQAAKQALDAIPPLLERFRQSVLAAAFRGDLTKQWRQQNPNVEPASELLKRIRQERHHRWEQDYLNQQKAKGKTPKDDKWKEKYQEPEPVDTTGLPELPERWCWANLDELSWHSGYGTSAKCSYEGTGLPVLRIPNVAEARTDLTDLKFADDDLGLEPNELLHDGDFLVIRTNGSLGLVGRGAVVGADCAGHYFASYLIRHRLLLPEVARKLLNLYWQSLAVRKRLERVAASSAGQHNVNLSKLQSVPIPLLPEAEQAVLNELLEQIWLAGERCHYELLFQKGKLERLDRSILAKAFRGELVPQDPNDEPASTLLERIHADR